LVVYKLTCGEQDVEYKIMDDKKPKAVVIISGGMDSVTLLYLAASLGHDVKAISFDYGQRHKKELLYAQKNCQKLGIDHKIVDLQVINQLIQGSALTQENIEVPDGHYTAETMKITVVPNRNSIMMSIAVGYAISIGAEVVFAGMHTGDHTIYPDCRPIFLDAFDVSQRLANEGFSVPKFHIEAPFINIPKDGIAKLGHELGVDYKDTWSCYKGGEKHCGRCGTCVERKEAFRLAGVTDPTEYLDPISDLEIPKQDAR
jgi:7-cyano-7-deazaguanine synthase